MKVHIKHVVFLLLASLAFLYLIDAAFADKPVKVTVTSTFPDSGEQGELIEEVEIDGTGFDYGSTAKFLVTDTKDDTQIDVLEVTYVGPNKLKAKIKVKDQALVIDYDVEVTTSSGRRGKGTTLFRVREREGQEDPCVNPVTFAPDFAFLRDTGRTKGRYKVPTEVTIFLAESFTGCEMSLLEVPIIEPVNQLRNLKFSSVEDENGFFGRVVWTSNSGPGAISVWKQDFYIVGADVILDGDALEIMREDSSVRENIYSLDLSHDTRTLVYQYWYAWPDPDNADVSLALNAVRMLNIESCDDPDTEPCGFGDLDQAFELDSDIGTTSDLIGFYYPVWGPLGERIYVRKGFDDPEIGAYKTLRYYDLEGNWQDLEWPPVVVKTDTVIADLGWFIRVSSGIVDGVEYLAYEREFSVETGGCEGIFIVNAEDCLVNENCSTEPEFAGAYATWSKDGRLIHAYDGWEPHGECGLGSVGYWDGSDNSLESLFDGYRPDAAGGIR